MGEALPFWGNVLIACAEWGCPPWEIAGGNKLRWFYRWVAYTEQRNKAIKAAENG